MPNLPNMPPEDWARIETLFEDASARPAAERDAWLHAACPNPATRQLIESMLAAHARAPEFLEQPADLSAVVDLSDARPDWRAGQRFGAYRVVREIGRGGMGIVYEAVRDDDQFARRVAIKVLPDWHGAHAERFRRERRLLAALDHPGIARLLDAGETADGTLYYVMELVEGETIDAWCRTQRLDLRQRVALVARVADAVAYAHQHLVVHRDLKASNILVTADGQPKLLDFGIATVLAESAGVEVTQTQLLTPASASPEQIRGETVSTATDVYSLGVLLFTLLTGRSPYVSPATNPHALAREICEDDPPAMKGRPPDGDQAGLVAVPRDLETIVHTALRKQPADRYASMEALAADLRRFLAGEPVQALRGSSLYRARKFIGRHRWGVAVAVTVLAFAAAGLAEIVRQQRIAERRFDTVREIANVVIFDVETAIADLPGSTPARKMIMERAMDYLDRLMREGVDSLPLQREIAVAYEKIGDVQGAPDRANLGEFDAAERSYRQALALQEVIVSRTRGEANDRRKLARVRRTLGLFLANVRGDITGALQMGREALAVSERAAAEVPDNEQVLKELALDQKFLGELYSGGNAHVRGGTLTDAALLYGQARDSFERLLTTSPRDSALRHYAAIVDMQSADVASQLGDRTAARAALERAKRVLSELAQEPLNNSARNNLVSVQGELAGFLLAEGRTVEALSVYQENLDSMRQAMAADAADVNLRASEISARTDLGRALVAAGRYEDASPLLATTAADARALADSTKSADFRLRSGLALVWSAEALIRRGLSAAGRAQLLEALHTYESAAADAPANVVIASRRSLVETKLGQVAAAQGDRDGALSYCEEAAHRMEPLRAGYPDVFDLDFALAEAYACLGDAQADRTAIAWYEKSLAARQRAPDPGPYSNARILLRSLADLKARLAAAREREH